MDVFLDSVRAAGDVAGVLETDDDTAYFYLCTVDEAGNTAIEAAINLGSEMRELSEENVDIVWDDDEQMVVLRVNNQSRVGYKIDGTEDGKLKFERMAFSG